MILNLGVIDLTYTTPASAPRKAPKKPGRRPRARRSGPVASIVTTGDVAGWLENRYHVMEHYWQLHGHQAAEYLTESVSGALETFMMGGPLSLDVYGGAMSKIEHDFRQMLSQRELDALGYPGIPTQAAREGRSSRHKSGFTKNRTPRPSFIDSGQYQASFKAWSE